MKTTIIGCGSWGARVASKVMSLGHRVALVDSSMAVRDTARRLEEFDPIPWSADPIGYLGVTGTASSSREPGALIIATPPGTRVELIRAALCGYGAPPAMIRVEKPLGLSVAEAEEITALCADAGVPLTVGFTLLHHPLYGAAFAYLRASRAKIGVVEGVRIGRAPRHDIHALLDQGIHTAAIAAHIDAPAHITAGINPDAEMRTTRFHTPHGQVVVDEIQQIVDTPHGIMSVRPGGDALRRELEAWYAGKHLGTPDLALRAQRTIDDHLAKAPVAA